MNFETLQSKNHAIVKSLVEKLDASNAAHLKAELLLLHKNGVQHVVLDLSQTKYCDSSGLSAVLSGNRMCNESNGQFIVCGLQPNVLNLMKIAKLDEVLQIREHSNQAIESLPIL